ncbi:MAG: hypothetical protein Q4A07_06855 [Coriobacteriales bacterium]|nr:hypothetical protein [Coriobacteriales bacterium]
MDMQQTQELCTEMAQLYSTTPENPRVIRLAIRMRDMIDEGPLRAAARKASRRFPYLCVELVHEGGRLLLAQNPRGVPVFHSAEPHTLGGEAANYHLMAFSWWDNWIWIDVFHAITDGTGAYELARTLLWYYCEERYGVRLQGERVRLLDDPVLPQEWLDPVAHAHLPDPVRAAAPEPAFDLVAEGGLGPEQPARDFSIAIPEAEFMRFNVQNDGSPATMLSLLLCRAIDGMFPGRTKPLRVNLCVNQRAALGAPLARHNLVGMARLEYKDGMRTWPIARQGTIFRGQTMAQTLEDRVLAGVAAQRATAERLRAMGSDAERVAACAAAKQASRRVATATVSYVGQARFEGSERYIRDMRLTTGQTVPVLMEVSAVNGIFRLDLMQTLASDALVRAFCHELEAGGVTYDLQDVRPVRLAPVDLPW